MRSQPLDIISKLPINRKWLIRYPFVRISDLLMQNAFEKRHVVVFVADHFEPKWCDAGALNETEAVKAMEVYRKEAERTAAEIVDDNGVGFTHSYFYPIEQYSKAECDILADLQSEGLGETEMHLHHGIDKPDTAENLRKTLTHARQLLSEEHKLLSKWENGETAYGFVHGNLALGNSLNNEFCGVDSELQILADTGCYADFTLPSAPDYSQVPIVNRIYECGGDLNQAVPHRTGRRVSVSGKQPQLPLIFEGPLVFNWTRKIRGIPVPRIDDGALTANQPLEFARFRRWLSANISVEGRSDWVFVKLYCHSFFDGDMPYCIGDEIRRFFSEVLNESAKSGAFTIHFASAREAFNMVLAAADGKKGSPNDYRNYRLRTIMDIENAAKEK